MASGLVTPEQLSSGGSQCIKVVVPGPDVYHSIHHHRGEYITTSLVAPEQTSSRSIQCVYVVTLRTYVYHSVNNGRGG